MQPQKSSCIATGPFRKPRHPTKFSRPKQNQPYGMDVIYVDFQKAFDRVPHKHLLPKLHAYCIRGKVYIWVEAFLSTENKGSQLMEQALRGEM